MKINFVIPSTVLGGGIRVIFNYCNYLISRGHDVVVYVPMIAYWPKHLGIPNIRTSIANTIIRGKKVPWFDTKFTIKLALGINNFSIRDADATIASAWYTAPDVYALSERKGMKFYFIQDYEIWNQKEDRVNATYKLEMHRIVITKNLQKLLKRMFDVDSTVIYNGQNENEYIQGTKKINKDKTIIMMCNMAHYKGGAQGLEVLEKVASKHKVNIILFGLKRPDNLPDIAQLEFYENPDRDKLLELYEKSDICLFPSQREAWGLSVTEAMAYKCAVVANNTGIVSELCTDGVHALISKNFDSKELEEKIERLLNDNGLLQKIQDNGYHLVKNLTWDKSYEKFESLLIKTAMEMKV